MEEREKLDAAVIEDEIYQSQFSEMVQGINSGEYSIFSGYKDAVLLGDSRINAYVGYGFLPRSQIFAVNGDTIEGISQWKDQIAQIQPKYIYISYGVNDMGLCVGEDRGEDGYKEVLIEQVNELLEVSPDSKIIVNSIIDDTPAALENAPAWAKIDEYNRQLKEACEEMGWDYVDNSALSKKGTADIYQSDGVHFVQDFYYDWSKNMLKSQFTGIE